MTFAEAMKVFNLGYDIARTGGIPFTGDSRLIHLDYEDVIADDWYTVNPPVITGTLDMVLEDGAFA